MSRSICIHGHFYQPPRENPWLEEIELQDPAYPYHDWNERINAECYAPNTASRILDTENRIIDIVNNYSRISFNFGPTLLSWLQKKDPETYAAVLEADYQSIQRFSGHGSALAQVYNHIIMPLANSRDKRTQIIWGIRDFEFRFKRQPEGMWLAETAVDLETLDLLAEQGIKFTILAPGQARRSRRLGEKNWQDVSGGKVDPKFPYLVSLPSGRSIVVFFYDGPISQSVAFAGVLNSGEAFAGRLAGAFVDKEKEHQLVHIATDGESYGHHHRYGEMALSYCLYHIEENGLAALTNYGKHLAENPPAREAEVIENSSWSCVHGVERWRADCGCNSGMKAGWHQKWRAPLRQANDWLRDRLTELYEREMKPICPDPWRTRDEYIEVVLDRTEELNTRFLDRQAGRELSWPERVRARQLLEMQRHAMLMYTSCGWFFDDISGIETVQIMLYACRAIQLAGIAAGVELEEEYLKLLAQAPGNLPGLENGAKVYEKFVKPEKLDLLRVGAHYGISSLFEEYPASAQLFTYWVDKHDFERVVRDGKRLAIGQAHLYSSLTAEEADVCFAVFHLGGEQFLGGVRMVNEQCRYDRMKKQLKTAFLKNGQGQLASLVDEFFGQHSYSLYHLFRDEQRKVLYQVAQPAFDQVKASLKQIYDQHYLTMRGMSRLRVPLPMALYTTARFVLNNLLRSQLESNDFDILQFRQSVEELKSWSVRLDHKTLRYHASRQVDQRMNRLFSFPENIDWLAEQNQLLKVLVEPPLSLELDLWRAQNLYFRIGQKLFLAMSRKAGQGSPEAERWRGEFIRLGELLKVRLK